MIDLTPLDVRKKRGDFKKTLRGYDALEVDSFLELAAERMEELVKANLTLEERAQRLGEQVVALGGRERAVNEALVTAQQLRDEIRDQAQRESEQIRREAERESAQLRKEAERDADHLDKEAQLQARELVADAERQLEERQMALADIESQRVRFLESYRQLLHRQMDLVQVEESRSPLDEVAVELDLGGGRGPRDYDRAGFSFESSHSDEPAADDGVDSGSTLVDEDREAAARALFAHEVKVPIRAGSGERNGEAPDDVLGDESGHADDVETSSAGPEGPVEVELERPADVSGEADSGSMSSDVESDSEGAIPVEGLAPTPDDVDHEATILPAPRVGA